MELNEALQHYTGDVILYYGRISREGYHQLSNILEQKVLTGKKSRVCLILATNGGDPDAGYRIARALNHYYKGSVEILIPDVCKSAGTLICIGASKIIIGDRGELGPLDVQLSKQNEMFENMSGLVIFNSLTDLQNRVINSFNDYLFKIRVKNRISTKIAADIAVELTQGLIAPIVDKLDPITLGEHLRAMAIAYEYGRRLNDLTDSLNEKSLESLLSDYPCHSFVIDRKEARTLFKNVECPDEITGVFYETIRGAIAKGALSDQTVTVIELKDSSQNNNKGNSHEQDTTGENACKPTDGAEQKDGAPDREANREGEVHEPVNDEPSTKETGEGVHGKRGA
ncbi:MAG: SppA protein [Chlorobiaceae bacterium]|nr:SppA protein [Chlorobiaceae bacterium]